MIQKKTHTQKVIEIKFTVFIEYLEQSHTPLALSETPCDFMSLGNSTISLKDWC